MNIHEEHNADQVEDKTERCDDKNDSDEKSDPEQNQGSLFSVELHSINDVCRTLDFYIFTWEYSCLEPSTIQRFEGKSETPPSSKKIWSINGVPMEYTVKKKSRILNSCLICNFS